MNEDGHSIDFDAPIPLPQEFKKLPEGDARFEVLATKRKQEERGKLGMTNILELTLLVTPANGDPGQKLVQDLVLHSTLAWKLYQFAASIGQYQHGAGEQLKMNWNAVPGSVGLCTIKHRAWTSKDGTKSGVAVEVDKWLDPKGRAAAGDKERVIEIKCEDPSF